MKWRRETPSPAQLEILAAIRFYDRRGWDWTSVVAFLSCKALGKDFWRWPAVRRIQGGRG